MSSIYLHVILLCSFLHRVSADIVPTISDLCPYTRFCHSGPAVSDRVFTGTGKRPCCLPCSCHDECHMIGNCCPDKKPNQFRDRWYPCREMGEYINNYSNTNGDADSNDMFRVIDSCPDEVIYGNFSESRCYGQANIGDLFFVTDAKTKHTYLNERCALCNGVKDIIKWDLHIQCDDMLNFNFFSYIDVENAILNGSCYFNAIPPSQEIGLFSICTRDEINICNVTREPIYFDPEVQRKCRSSNRLRVLEHYPFSSYVNPYCMLCNMNTPQYPSLECDEIPFGFDPGRFTFLRLTAILHGKRLINNKKDLNALTCEEAQVLDPISRKCVDLECPQTTYPERGQCRSMFDEVYGYALDLHYTISEDGGQHEYIGNRQRASLLFTFIHNKFSDAGRNCGICMVSVSENGTSAFITLISKPGCHLISFLRFIGSQSWANKLNFKSRNGLSFKVVVSTSDARSQHYYPYVRYSICKLHEPFNEQTVYCPSIVLENESLISYGNGNNREWLQSINEAANLLENDQMRLCLDEYISISKRLYNSADTCVSFNVTSYILLHWFIYCYLN